MSNAVKQRKKALASKSSEEAKAEQDRGAAKAEKEKCPPVPVKPTEPLKLCPEPRTVLCLLSLSVCLASCWFVFQQSVARADVEKRFRLLEIKTSELEALEDKIGLLSAKLQTSDGVLQETIPVISVVARLEEDVSSLRGIVHNHQDSENLLTQKVQDMNEKFQNVTDLWKVSFDKMTKLVDILKSEAKTIHNQVKSHINTAEKGIKLLSERLNELEDSTIRNTRALKRQEDDEIVHIEQQLESNGKTIEKLEVEQSVLVAKNTELSQNIQDYEPKLEECRSNLPIIETAVRTVLKVSKELIGIEKKMEDLTMQTFNMEDNMLKAVSEIYGIQKVLEGMQYDNSILKMQSELGVLKTRVQEYALSSSTKGASLAENKSEVEETLDEN
ncbi:hypothetical protein NDU88_002613 [Pleurodeles waltl]|uniref:Inhibitor of nuclear factor kappa-B kinase-interacting protein n=1 Tax=Pleurodeles waltl TaxID=8319 RepID=A0AAV7SD95_PLEWA|nr:hypothetical protein NDU88_002613 [Pleurodeles waltl]